MTQGLSPNLQHLETSATIAISQEAKRRRAAGEDVIDLGAGGAIPAPAWVSYPQIVHLARARPVLVSGDPEWSLKLSVKDLDRVVPGAQGLMLCSPCNPTGGVYTHGEIRAIAEWARKRGV